MTPFNTSLLRVLGTRAIVVLSGLWLLAPILSAQQVAPASVDDFIRASMRSARIPGLALGVVHGDDVVYHKGYGIAGPGGRPVTAQTPFILGSTSKAFTALAIMQLVEAGTIALDAPVTTYLPWFRTADVEASAKITVRHLLQQTSGLRTYEGRKGLSDNDQSPGALEKGVRELHQAPLRQPPGQRFEYSNENYNVLGLIVQAVSGVSYEEYVRTHIFGPLRMHQSAAAMSDVEAADLATGYRYWLGWPVAFDAPYPRRATPAGLLISSAEDMTRYVSAQLNGGRYANRHVLSSRGIAAMHAPGAPIIAGIDYAMGWAVRTAPGPTKIWHDGDESNFHSHVRLYPEQRLGIVVLMNVGGTGNEAAIEHMVNGISETLLGHPQDVPVDSPWTTLSHLALLLPLLIAAMWAAWSYRSRRIYLPLVIELAAVGAIWILVPAKVQTPVATIALFAPDVFAVGVVITVVALGCATARVSALRFRRRSPPVAN